MRLKIAVPEAHVTKPVLDAALESVTRLNEQMLEQGQIPTFERALRSHGIRWRPEPPGDEHFDSADRVVGRRWGDCDDLAPHHAASLRHTGEDPGATAEVYRSGPSRWHAIVRRSDGSIDDPSLRAGMRAGVPAGVFGVAGAVLPLMVAPRHDVSGAYLLRPQIALRPHFGAVQARADIPWHWEKRMLDGPVTSEQIAMTALHTAPVAHTALTGAIQDAIDIAAVCGAGDDEHIDRLCALADACEGATYDELVHVYGEDHAEAAAAVVGSLFGKVMRGAGRLAKGAVKFVPGVGPAAHAAIDYGGKAFKGKKRRPAPTTTRAPSSAASTPFAAVEHGARNIVFHFH